MPVFLIVSAQDKNPELETKIKTSFPDDHYVLADNQWLIEAEETTKDLAEKIGIRDGGFGSAVAFRIEGYSGYNATSLWAWLELD